MTDHAMEKCVAIGGIACASAILPKILIIEQSITAINFSTRL